jgi:hypothetical protein
VIFKIGEGRREFGRVTVIVRHLSEVSHVVVVGLHTVVGQRVARRVMGWLNAMADVSADALAARYDRCGGARGDAANAKR